MVEEGNHPDVIETFERLSARSGIGNIHRTIANSPEVFRNFIGLSQALRYSTRLDPIERELAICVVLERHDGEYELDAHRRFAKLLGATDPQVSNVRNRAEPGLYTERMQQILLFAEHLAADPAERSLLPSHEIEAWLDNRERIELGLTLAIYLGLAHFTALFDVPAENFDAQGAPSLERAASMPR